VSPLPETTPLAPSGPDELLFVDRDRQSIQLVGEDGVLHRRFSGFRTVGSPAWSSDGRAFAVQDLTYTSATLYRVMVDDSQRVEIGRSPTVFTGTLLFLGDASSGSILVGAGGPCPLLRIQLEPYDGECLRHGHSGAISPDGTRMVWGDYRKPGELWVGSVDGSDSTRVTVRSPDGTRALTVVWANSQWFAFAELHGENTEVYRARRDGRSVQQLTHDPAYDSPTGISPDGRWLAFVSLREPQGTYVTAMDGTGTHWLTAVAGQGTTWSPDGEQIAMATFDQLLILQADGSNPRILSASGGASWRPRR
jgi:Tol biopolymer transport system component